MILPVLNIYFKNNYLNDNRCCIEQIYLKSQRKQKSNIIQDTVNILYMQHMQHTQHTHAHAYATAHMHMHTTHAHNTTHSHTHTQIYNLTLNIY